MATVLHLIDAHTPPAAAGLLDLVRRHRADDVIAAVGSFQREDLPDSDALVRRWPWSSGTASIRKLAREHAARVVHCWSPGLAQPAAAAGLPMCLSAMAPLAAGATVRIAVRGNVTFVAPSAFMQQMLRSAGAAEQTIVVIPPAAEAPTSAAPATRQAASLQRRRLTLIAPPQHDNDRGPYWAVWALGLIMQIDDGVELLIPAQGPAAQRAFDLARENNMLDRVRLIAPGESGEAWATADAAVLYDRDGIGLTGLAQAVAAGVPVIAADAGELADQLLHERTGLLAAPAKALMLARAIWRLIQEPALGPRLEQQASSELSRMKDVSAWLAAMESLYRRLS